MRLLILLKNERILSWSRSSKTIQLAAGSNISTADPKLGQINKRNLPKNNYIKYYFYPNNQGKETDLQEILASLDHKVYFPTDLSIALDLVEDGHAQTENAPQKAGDFYTGQRVD